MCTEMWLSTHTEEVKNTTINDDKYLLGWEHSLLLEREHYDLLLVNNKLAYGLAYDKLHNKMDKYSPKNHRYVLH